MAKTTKRPAGAGSRGAPTGKEKPSKPVRPALLAGGLGLMWFVQFQQVSGDPEAPAWGYGLALGLRLLADIVGAWIVIAVVQLLFACGRLIIARLFPDAEGEAP